jgi:hypothetical protein
MFLFHRKIEPIKAFSCKLKKYYVKLTRLDVKFKLPTLFYIITLFIITSSTKSCRNFLHSGRFLFRTKSLNLPNIAFTCSSVTIISDSLALAISANFIVNLETS